MCQDHHIELGFSTGRVRVGPGHTVTVRGTVSHRTPHTRGVVTGFAVLSGHRGFLPKSRGGSQRCSGDSFCERGRSSKSSASDVPRVPQARPHSEWVVGRGGGSERAAASTQTLLRLVWAEGQGWGPRCMGPVGKSVGGMMRLHGRRCDSLFFLCRKGAHSPCKGRPSSCGNPRPRPLNPEVATLRKKAVSANRRGDPGVEWTVPCGMRKREH